MATKTVTIDTNEWAYPDMTGITHIVTNAQTFTFELTDGGASAVTYQNDVNKTLTCTDGTLITIRPQSVGATNGTGNGNARHTWGPTLDAQETVATYGLQGFAASHSSNNVTQYWKPISLLVDDTDTPTAITGTFEDQFGRRFSWTTVTVS